MWAPSTFEVNSSSNFFLCSNDAVNWCLVSSQHGLRSFEVSQVNQKQADVKAKPKAKQKKKRKH